MQENKEGQSPPPPPLQLKRGEEKEASRERQKIFHLKVFISTELPPKRLKKKCGDLENFFSCIFYSSEISNG